MPVEDQQRVVHVLTVIAVVGAALLLAVGGVVGAVQVEQDVGRHATSGALPLLKVDRHQRLAEPVAGTPVDGVLQPGEGRLAGQVGPILGRPTADQLQERVGP